MSISTPHSALKKYRFRYKTLFFTFWTISCVQSYSVPRKSTSWIPIYNHYQSNMERRRLLDFIIPVLVTCGASPLQTMAETDKPTPFYRETPSFSYIFVPPEGFEVSNKPLKTHLDEMNFSNDAVFKGYQYGITVDPVRIQSLRQFGSPEEVAAKIVTAEVNRDGIFEVTLVADPFEDNNGAYIIEYLSDGKRGKKHYVTKTIVYDGKLFVLTVQSKEEDFTSSRRQEVYEAIKSFQVSKKQ